VFIGSWVACFYNGSKEAGCIQRPKEGHFSPEVVLLLAGGPMQIEPCLGRSRSGGLLT
jgi:hypothetical protein